MYWYKNNKMIDLEDSSQEKSPTAFTQNMPVDRLY